MHAEFNTLYLKCDQQKQLLKKLENYQSDINKLKETKLGKQQQLSNDKELQDEFKKSSDELKKREQTWLAMNKKQNELDTKIKELQEKKNQLKESSANKDQETRTANLNTSTEVNAKVTATVKKVCIFNLIIYEKLVTKQ